MIYRRSRASARRWRSGSARATSARAAWRRSSDRRCRTEGFIDGEYFTDAAQGSDRRPRRASAFQLWTVMNAVLWHASWVEGREDCF